MLGDPSSFDVGQGGESRWSGRGEGDGRPPALFWRQSMPSLHLLPFPSTHLSSCHVLPTISPRSPLHTSFTIYSYPFRYDMVHSQHFGDAIRNTVVWRYLVLDEGHKV